MDKIAVIIVAGGSGNRMGGDTPKQFLPLAGKPVLVHTVERFRSTLPDSEIIVVLAEAEIGRWESIAAQHGLLGTHRVCAGGSTRFDSVKNALDFTGICDYIMVHDGVRPLVSKGLIFRCLESAKKNGTAIPIVELADSFRIVNNDGSSQPFDRNRLRAVQTPQVFRSDILLSAYETGFVPVFTDDASVVENSDIAVTLCPGERTNIKITTPEDLIVAEVFLKITRL